MKKKIIILLFVMLIVLGNIGWAQAENLKDMPKNWSKPYLEYALENNLLKGSAGYIRPEDNLTRAELATIVNRILGTRETSDIGEFLDVDPKKWYYPELEKAVASGILNGSNGSLKPESDISREEAFVVMARVFDLYGRDDLLSKKFVDSSQISSWAREEINGLVGKGYIKGDSKNFLNPKENITRAEYAVILKGLLGENLEKLDFTNKEIEANILVKNSGVKLENTIINGDLILAEGLETSELNIEGLKLNGRLVIRSGLKLDLKSGEIEEISILGKGAKIKLDSKTRVKEMVSKTKFTLEGLGKLDYLSLKRGSDLSHILIKPLKLDLESGLKDIRIRDKYYPTYMNSDLEEVEGEKEKIEGEKDLETLGKKEISKLEKEKLEADKKAKLEKEKLEADKKAKLEKEKIEADKKAKLEREKLEADKKAKLEKEMIEADKKAKLEVKEYIDPSSTIDEIKYIEAISNDLDLENMFDRVLINYPTKLEFKVTRDYLDSLIDGSELNSKLGDIFKKSNKKDRVKYTNHYIMMRTSSYSSDAKEIDFTIDISYPDLNGGNVLASSLREYDRAAEEIADEFVKNEIEGRNLSDPEKVLKINDYLGKRAEYNYAGLETYNIEDHIPYGVLVKKKGVCESYAKAFKLIGDKAGLENIYVTGKAYNYPESKGEDHAWNMVKIKTDWYSIDTTWNDIGSEVRYDYFLKSDDFMAKSHVRDKEDSYPLGNGREDFLKILNLN